MGAAQLNHQIASNGTGCTNQLHEQLAEHDRMIDSHLVRITRLQMLLHLEEARLLRSQAAQRELQLLLRE